MIKKFKNKIGEYADTLSSTTNQTCKLCTTIDAHCLTCAINNNIA